MSAEASRGAYPTLRQQAEELLFTQCDGCTACQQRAKAVARDYLSPERKRLLAEVVEVIYLTHGCSCDEHPSNGTSAACQAWRRRAAEQVAAALRHPDEGGMALRPCPRCGALIRAEHRMCWDCAATATATAHSPRPDANRDYLPSESTS